MNEEAYCDCDSGDANPPEFCEVSSPKAAKSHTCDECGGTIFKGETYRRTAGKWEGEFITFRECCACSELREWATISKPCFCAFEIGSLHKRVKLMVADVAPLVEGFMDEYQRREAVFAHRRTPSKDESWGRR